jgi:hypothetical protein
MFHATRGADVVVLLGCRTEGDFGAAVLLLRDARAMRNVVLMQRRIKNTALLFLVIFIFKPCHRVRVEAVNTQRPATFTASFSSP